MKNDDDRHFRKHTGDNPYQCEHCEKALYRSEFDRHFMTHTENKPYQCNPM